MLQAGRKKEGGRVVRKEGMIEGRKERQTYKRGEDFILEEHINQKKKKKETSSLLVLKWVGNFFQKNMNLINQEFTCEENNNNTDRDSKVDQRSNP